MKRIILSLNIASFLLLLVSCNESKNHQLKDQTELLSNLFKPQNLPKQGFQIKPDRDTTLIGENGTILRIYKNSFEDKNGNQITTPIDIELKEALTPIDIVSSNLTTTTNGKPLQTGGMIYLNAKSGNQQLEIARNKSIGVMVPNENIDQEMKIYKGVKTDTGINWVDPTPILNNEIKLDEKKQIGKPLVDTFKIENQDARAIFDFVDEDTLRIKQLGKRKGNVVRKQNNNFGQFANEISEKGFNKFSEDYKNCYIFELKKLGWANIDRLYVDPRTQQVELITKISNSKDFEKIYITMVISNMYLPGYQKKDDTFSFTHGDDENTQLPIGEKAVIFATAYKDNSPYFEIITTTIKSKETINLNLKKTDEQFIKTTLMKKL